jgi:hypothetical protein
LRNVGVENLVCVLPGGDGALRPRIVWWLNQREIRKHLQPMLDEIDRVNQQLTYGDFD